VHFEIIGKDPEKLRGYAGDPFGWEFDSSAQVAKTVSEPMNHGFVNGGPASDGTGNPGGVGRSAGYDGHVISHVGVPNVEGPCSRRKAPAGSVRWVR
jgi:hypothetical protein